ncbi:hypothetical protein ACNR9Q_04940 [Maribacter sp. X9]|uniref:hypothetical protein n=1 Tax=Maribacter sp. X9 TaxID=3402159 RepID=UPI003AF3411E
MNDFNTSEYKVTYLLGAGASAKQLPTVKGTGNNDGIAHMIKYLSNDLKHEKGIDSKYDYFIKEIISDLEWLSENSIKYGTPDTFAKFLYLKDRTSIPRLKRALSFYFTYEQFIKNKKDIRALVFLITVMQTGSIFPSNIKILNWNYDFQVQIAAENFIKEEIYNISGATVHKPPLIEYYPSIGNEMIVNNNENNYEHAAMVHLNGIAGFYFEQKNKHILNYFTNRTLENTNQLIEGYTNNLDEKYDLLTFAWEKNEASNYLRKRLEIAKSIISESDILVVIGYSFPFFNREMDSEIFEALKSSEKFKKIYYQDPFRTGDFLKNQFQLSNKIEIEHIKETENYFIPLEL